MLCAMYVYAHVDTASVLTSVTGRVGEIERQERDFVLHLSSE